jgi:hypothetical protein
MHRITWGSTTFFLDNATYVDVVQICRNVTKEADFQSIKDATMVLTPQPISVAAVNASAASGETPLNLRARAQICKSF